MIRNEISKIVKSPYMWGVLLFCILINCGILCFENTEDFVCHAVKEKFGSNFYLKKKIYKKKLQVQKTKQKNISKMK